MLDCIAHISLGRPLAKREEKITANIHSLDWLSLASTDWHSCIDTHDYVVRFDEKRFLFDNRERCFNYTLKNCYWTFLLTSWIYSICIIDYRLLKPGQPRLCCVNWNGVKKICKTAMMTETGLLQISTRSECNNCWI